MDPVEVLVKDVFEYFFCLNEKLITLPPIRSQLRRQRNNPQLIHQPVAQRAWRLIVDRLRAVADFVTFGPRAALPEPFEEGPGLFVAWLFELQVLHAEGVERSAEEVTKRMHV